MHNYDDEEISVGKKRFYSGLLNFLKHLRSFNKKIFLGVLVVLSVLVILSLYGVYTHCRIDVPEKHYAVLTHKTGIDIDNDQEVAPDEKHKGIQKKLLSEGRYFRNPYSWSWTIKPMVDIPKDKMGVRIRLYGEDLPYGDFLAIDETHKGIIEEVLRPGRYTINAKVIDRKTKEEVGIFRSEKSDYVEIIELWDPKVIPAGYKGVVTNLAGPLPEDPNVLLVDENHRGAQEKTLDSGTYYMNPYMWRINSIDTRSQRFNLAEQKGLSFPSKDGFPISLMGIIEFRVIPETAAKTYVLYNDVSNDNSDSTNIDDEIIQKVILPNARAFCRMQGANSSARDFIGGKTRVAFQEEFQKMITETCKRQGIEIIQALVTKIRPPQAIASPLREREVAIQEQKQYRQQVLQQGEEARLTTEKRLIEQKKALITAERSVVETVTLAMEEQGVKLQQANRDMEVAEKNLQAARDRFIAIIAKNKAEAEVIGYENEAYAAGWKKAVQALGSGNAYAEYVLKKKLSPGFKSIMVNTADSLLMDNFKNFNGDSSKKIQ